jgi:hypothetical protein
VAREPRDARVEAGAVFYGPNAATLVENFFGQLGNKDLRPDKNAIGGKAMPPYIPPDATTLKVPYSTLPPFRPPTPGEIHTAFQNDYGFYVAYRLQYTDMF